MCSLFGCSCLYMKLKQRVIKAGRALCAVYNLLMQCADASVQAEGELTDLKLDHYMDKKR